jgi:1-deoxy-D-xylulose-5-phosphate reductoisomerase
MIEQRSGNHRGPWLFDMPFDKKSTWSSIPRVSSIRWSNTKIGSLSPSSAGRLCRIPIAYALSYPEGMPGNDASWNLAALKTLTFAEPDERRFPCLTLARRAGEAGGSMPAVLNAANEVAVEILSK